MMKTVSCAIATFLLLAAGSISLQAEPPSGSDPMQQCHKVFSEVGLIVRATASSKGRKLGSLSKGEKVQLDGEKLGETGAVYPMIQDGAEGTYWIKLKKPIAGYVLYSSDDDADYTYIVPCKN